MEPVQPLCSELFPSAAELLANAFYDNPAHVYICPDPATRAGQLEWLLGANLHAQPTLDSSFCIVQNSAVVAMGFWTQPASERDGLVRKIRAGLLRAPFRLGFAGFCRLLEVSAGVDRHRDEALDTQRPENVAFYQHFGFEPVSEEIIGTGQTSFRNWVMVSAPAG